jgi:phage terminase large subunit-like protein
MINEMLTKTFNLFVSSESAWLDIRHWEESPKTLPAQEPESSYISFDLSLTRDLCCVCTLDRYDMERFHVKFMFFLPHDSMDYIPLHDQSIFRDAVDRGTLKLTPGNVSDYEEIENYIMSVVNAKNIKMVGYDPWNSNALVAKLYERGLPLQKIGQGMASLSAATKQTEKLIYQHAIGHDHDPMMVWQLGNVSIYQDINNNIKARKPESNPNAKIDGVVSLIMAIHLHMENPIFALPRVMAI